MKRLKEEQRQKKDKKKGKREEEGERLGGDRTKRMKVDASAKIAEKSKSAVYSGLFRPKQDKNKVTSAEDLMMLAPGSKHGQGKAL